jgi:hypothetical protein
MGSLSDLTPVQKSVLGLGLTRAYATGTDVVPECLRTRRRRHVLAYHLAAEVSKAVPDQVR